MNDTPTDHLPPSPFDNREPEPMPVLLLAARLVRPDIHEIDWVSDMCNGLILFTAFSNHGSHHDFEFDLNLGTIGELFQMSQHVVQKRGVAIKVVAR